MGDFRILIDGDGAGEAADELTAILQDGEEATLITWSAAAQVPEERRKFVDPLTLAAVILAVPPAILAARDIADRIAKRRKAQALIAAAVRLRREKRVTITVVGPDGTTWSLDRLETDTVLEIGQQSTGAP